jgi:hypothetical protein
MATFTLQTLELRAASLAGACATSRESKGQFMAMLGNPVGALSLSWHPQPAHLVRTGPEPCQGHRGYSMDTLSRRAGRSARSAGVPGQTVVARLRGGIIQSGWSCTGRLAPMVCG